MTAAESYRGVDRGRFKLFYHVTSSSDEMCRYSVEQIGVSLKNKEAERDEDIRTELWFDLQYMLCAAFKVTFSYRKLLRADILC